MAEMFNEMALRGHEQVSIFHDENTGMRALVAIHSTVLGPALGGCRVRAYESDLAAWDDVLRLSEGMTYKNALAGIEFGGGKACLLENESFHENRRAIFLKFGECVNSFAGRYITAEDLGTTAEDIRAIAERTSHVVYHSKDTGGVGDLSPWTALGMAHSIRTAVDFRQSRSLQGVHVAIQGVGNVGHRLAVHLKEAGCELTIADRDHDRARQVQSELGASLVSEDEIYTVKCDVFAPCAVGQTLRTDTIERLRCDIVAGAANNQLESPEIGHALHARNVLYCPDFAINAGGAIAAAEELVSGGLDTDRLRTRVTRIGETLREILETAHGRNAPPEDVALEIALNRILAARGKNQIKERDSI